MADTEMVSAATLDLVKQWLESDQGEKFRKIFTFFSEQQNTIDDSSMLTAFLAAARWNPTSDRLVHNMSPELTDIVFGSKSEKVLHNTEELKELLREGKPVAFILGSYSSGSCLHSLATLYANHIRLRILVISSSSSESLL